MKRDRDKRHRAGRRGGFTLAETLMVVAIILILGGVIFINVLRYMRSMAQLERDGIAKEIFVAAQNHLTMAESQGYLGKSDYGSEETESGKETGIYYFVVNGSESFNGSRVLDLMLPFASVDETVRLGGSYIVRYQANPALVLDVFYCTRTGTRFGHTLSDADYSGSDRYLRGTVGPENKAKRRTWGSDRAVLGWYGGEEAQNLERGQELKAPEVEVINADKLLVRVKNTNSSNNQASLRLVLTGEASGKQAAFTLTFDNTDTNVRHDVLEDTYTVILDDITNDSRQGYDLHFHALFPDFLPGENLLIRAVAFSNQVLTNIAYSGEKKTNSLFADIRYSDSGQAGSGTGDG
ncbi:MAG: type II secretion system protein, partial [Eubacteriales bacterium]|nr:type II secretion system protein [Eubacteriales bacterium]